MTAKMREVESIEQQRLYKLAVIMNLNEPTGFGETHMLQCHQQKIDKIT